MHITLLHLPLDKLISLSFMHRLANVLGEVYEGSGNPVRLLEGYLSVMTVGTFAGRVPPPFSIADFDPKRATQEAPIS